MGARRGGSAGIVGSGGWRCPTTVVTETHKGYERHQNDGANAAFTSHTARMVEIVHGFLLQVARVSSYVERGVVNANAWSDNRLVAC